MKRLFNDHDEWTEECGNINQEITELIKPIIIKYSELGYSLRDIDYIAQHAINTVILRQIVLNQASRAKEKLKNKKENKHEN